MYQLPQGVQRPISGVMTMALKRYIRSSLVLVSVYLVLSSFTILLISPSPVFNDVASNRFTVSAPTINSPPDLTYENGTLGKKIVWTPSSANPKNYTVTRNGTIYLSGAWTGGQIQVLLNHLYTQKLVRTLPITFRFVCTVFDTTGASASDEVLVHIIPDESPPIIVGPGNFSYEVGSFGHKIIWNITEANPDFYNVSRTSNEPTHNATTLLSGPWNGQNITISGSLIDGLNASRWYLYRLFVNDTFGRNATHYVNVTVTPDTTPPTVTSPDDIYLEYGQLGVKIKWFIYDSNPKNYSIRVTTHFIDTAYGNTSDSRFHRPQNITQPTWTFTNPKGMDLIVSLDYLYLGNYTFDLLLFDDFGHNNTDTLNVTVYRDVRAPVVVNRTADYSYEEGYRGHWVNWSIDENNPRSYNITRNGTLVRGGIWRGENFSIRADRLPVGRHIFNLTLVDFFYQKTVSMVVVTVTPDAHLPIVTHVAMMQSYRDAYWTELSVQAWVWDINNLSSVVVYWGTDPANPESKNMTLYMIQYSPTTRGLYTAELNAYPVGTVVWYRIVATDNSSVRNQYATNWSSVTVSSHVDASMPGVLWGGILILGLLSTLVLLNLYFRTKPR